MIQNAMKQIQYSISMSKNSKSQVRLFISALVDFSRCSQALDVIRKLRDIMPIVRANMLLRLVCSVSGWHADPSVRSFANLLSMQTWLSFAQR